MIRRRVTLHRPDGSTRPVWLLTPETPAEAAEVVRMVAEGKAAAVSATSWPPRATSRRSP